MIKRYALVRLTEAEHNVEEDYQEATDRIYYETIFAHPEIAGLDILTTG